MFACAQTSAAEGVVDITHAKIDAVEDGYRLDAKYAFDLNHGLEDAIQHGVQLHFTTRIVLTRPRWYWLDEKTVSARRTMRISYNVLTRQYHVSVLGSVQQSYDTLDDALFLIRRPSRWVFAGKGALKPGETYTATLSMDLDRSYLSKPIQINASGNGDWRLESNKKTFTYRAE
jgi:hypothetical protein